MLSPREKHILNLIGRGRSSREIAQQLGIETTVMPARYTIPDLVDALVEYFGQEREHEVRDEESGIRTR